MPTNTETPLASIDPRDVKLPLKKHWPPGEITVGREEYHISDLPVDAQDAVLRYFGVPSDARPFPWGSMDAEEYPNWDSANKSVYQCTECGYLTTSSALSPTAYRRYECGNDACSNRTNKATRNGFRRCKDEQVVVDLDTGEKRHITEVSTDDVPNHPSHLGRLKNQFEKGLSSKEYREQVAAALNDW